MVGGISRRSTNRLTDRSISSFIKSGNPGQKLSDGGGMFLTLTPARTPAWRIKYRIGGKEQLYSIGTYPGISLEGARVEREWVKAQLRAGRDPVQARALNKAAGEAASDNTFRAVTLDWLSKRKAGWSGIHYTKSSRALERDVLPKLGALPVSDITPAMVAKVIEAIDKRGARDTAGKILQHVSGILKLAQARGLCRDNPATPVHEVLSKRPATARRPALLQWAALGDVLRKAEAARVSPGVRLAHRLCAFSVARISNIVQAEWSEFDLEATPAVWMIPRAKMKVQERDHDHKIILGPTIAAELRTWRSVIGSKGHLFPSSVDGKHITRESIEKLYRVTLGLEGKHTPHGWRSAFSTLARDFGFDREVVELALDHIHDNEVARAYDRGERLEQRVRLMLWWDEQLAHAQRGADVIPLKAAGAA